METIGNRLPWKMNGLETFQKRQIIKRPTFRLMGVFPLHVESGLAAACQVHLGSNILYLYTSYLASQY